MTISASQVRELRDQTGAGMMDCKEALKETGGDFDSAVDFLRKKGMKSAEKKASRATSEGRVYVTVDEDGKEGTRRETTVRSGPTMRADDEGRRKTKRQKEEQGRKTKDIYSR